MSTNTIDEAEALSITDPFQDFDPLDLKMPSELAQFLMPIAFRAKEQIQHRSRNEVQTMMMGVNWILQDYEPMQVDPEFIEDPSLLHDHPLLHGLHLSPAQTMRNMMNRVDIAGQEDLPDPEWNEYFAVLSLATIGIIITTYRETIKKSNTNQIAFDLNQFELMGIRISRAMEALCFANDMLEADIVRKIVNQQIEEGVKEKIQLRSQDMANKRYESLTRMKRKFIQHWLHHCMGKTSKSKCADKFIQMQSADKIAALNIRNPKRVLLDALASFGKGKFK